MATGKGVIQGYTGVAAVDSAHQIIVEAQAHGTGSEQEVLLPVVTAMQDRQDVLSPHSLITADAGYHSEANLQALATREVDALIADNDMRRRDERFATQARHLEAIRSMTNRGPPAESASPTMSRRRTGRKKPRSTTAPPAPRRTASPSTHMRKFGVFAQQCTALVGTGVCGHN
jgi:hypothetical protein